MRFLIASSLAIIGSSSMAAEPARGFKLPPGFEVHQFAGPELANDIYALHIDADGRIVVAGKGYVRELIDTDNDGTVDRAVELIPAPKGGAMGLLWEKENLYVVVDGGLHCYAGVTGKKPSAEKPTTILAIRADGEHAAHAVKRGPDGSLYLMCGNNSGIAAKTITDPMSPVKDPVAGGFLRIDAKTNAVSLMADGFRNAYDFDFNSRGQAITFDSDNERCVGLPWFEPTRLYHVRPNGHYGWLNPQFTQTWRKPPDFPDVVTPILTAGRGSPTGVVCYRHTAFPKAYHDGVFFADWTFGKVYFSPLTPAGETLAGKLESFLESTGESGFAPTGMAVHPTTGDLYVASGGRGTRGVVYRIRAIKPTPDAKPIPWEKFDEKPFVRITGDVTEADWAKAKTPAERLLVLRKYQISLGDLGAKGAIGTAYEGYTFRKAPTEKIWESLTRAFPTGEPATDRELMRLFAAFEVNDIRITNHVLNSITRSDFDPRIQIHGQIVMSRLGGPLPKTGPDRLTTTFLLLDKNLARAGMSIDSNWPLRMKEVLKVLLDKHEGLAAVIEKNSTYGAPEHLWIAQTPGMSAQAAAEAFVRRSKVVEPYDWKAGQVGFLFELPANERRTILEQLLKEGTVDDAVVAVLSKIAIPVDVPVFKKALGSSSASTVMAALHGLEAQRVEAGPKEWVTALKSLRRFADPKTDEKVRKALVAWLVAQTKQTHGDKVASWEAWLTMAHPDAAKELTGSTGYDPAKWKTKLAAVDWDAGDAANGQKLFAKANCAACHNGGQASGPSLEGASKRFNRDDLLSAILDPNRDVSPRYRTIRVTTIDEKTYEGIVIYEATDGVILQTTADATVRIAGKDIQSTKPGLLSLMPTGLLDESKPTDIADLLAYLKTLDAPKR